MPRRAPAGRRPARRPQRRHEHRVRRFAFLMVISIVLVVTLLLTAFGNAPQQRAAFLAPAPAQRLLPAGQPQPLVIAKLDALRIQLPIEASRVTAIGFHSAGDGTLALEPVGRQGNEGLLARLGHRLFGGGGGGPVWYQLSGGQGPETGALDVGAAAGTNVYSPVDGTIVGVTPYVLNGRSYGVRLDIQPASAPSIVVSLTQIDPAPALSVGKQVTASVTKLGIVRDLSGVQQQSLAHYTNDAGNHVELEVRPAATLTLP